MAKEQPISARGVIISENGNASFTVQLESGHELLCRVNGSMVKHNIRVQTDDHVIVEITPYDLTRGRIVYREKKGKKAAN